MTRTALVIGGTGPTEPGVVNGLVGRGFDVSILHTGHNEVDTLPPEVPHIHTNPFRIDDVEEALGQATFDVVYAMYGRLGDLVPYFVGRCGQFIAVGGIPVYRGYARPAQNRSTRASGSSCAASSTAAAGPPFPRRRGIAAPGHVARPDDR